MTNPRKTVIVTGGSIVNITTTMAGHPIAGINATVAM